MIERIEAIKRQLGIADNVQDEVLTEMFQRYSRIAMDVCHRTEATDIVLDIVQDTVCGAYNQRGGEGFSTSGAGGQSYVMKDLTAEMTARLIASNQRMARF